jgi:hypothetical protein
MCLDHARQLMPVVRTGSQLVKLSASRKIYSADKIIDFVRRT